MKKILFFTFFLVSLTGISQNSNYNSTLVKKLGTDDYGIKMYVFVILKTGNNTTADTTFIDSSFSGHMNNINRLVEEDLLVAAGPFGKNDDQFRGFSILNVATLEEAEKLAR